MTLLLERGDIPGFKVGRRRRRHEKRGGAWVRGHRVSGLVQRASSADVRQRSWLTVGWSGMLGNFLLFTCNLSVVVPSDFTLSQWDT